MALNPYESPRFLEPEPERPAPDERSQPWVGTAVAILLLGSSITLGIAAANLAVIMAVYGRR